MKILGKRVNIRSPKDIEKTLEYIRGVFDSSWLTLKFKNHSKKVSYKRYGIALNIDQLREYLKLLLDCNSISYRFYYLNSLKRSDLEIDGIEIDKAQLLGLLFQLKEEWDIPPQNLKVDTLTKKLIPSKEGYRIDIYGSLEEIIKGIKEGKEVVELKYWIEEPELKDIKRLDISSVLGWFETPYSQLEKDKDRVYNLKLVASRVDGWILFPQKEFDFNKVVGPRIEAKGFRVAPVIASGQLIDDIGGGTCQIASTLHAASFFAGLEIIKRKPHSRPSSYIRLGLDATVSYPQINLVLKNNFSFPVVFHVKVGGGKVRVEIWGPPLDQEVIFVRHITKTSPFSRKIIEDDTLPYGIEVITQKGIPGFELRKFRIIKRGDIAWREIYSDIYPPTTEIVRKGTNKNLKLKDFLKGLVEEGNSSSKDFGRLPCDMRIIQKSDGTYLEQTRCR